MYLTGAHAIPLRLSTKSLVGDHGGPERIPLSATHGGDAAGKNFEMGGVPRREYRYSRILRHTNFGLVFIG